MMPPLEVNKSDNIIKQVGNIMNNWTGNSSNKFDVVSFEYQHIAENTWNDSVSF